MLHHIDVRNTKISAGILTLTLEDPSNGFTVRGIEGLDPVKATLVSSSFANLDGEEYHTGRRDVRNIIITLGLKHAVLSVAELRKQLYDVFMPKSEIQMSFYQVDGSYLNINGVVETCEAPPFTKDPAMTISVMCYDPDFVAPSLGTVSGVVVTSAVQGLLNYAGTVPTGISFALTAPAAVPRVAIYIAPEGLPEKVLWFNTPLNAGDQLQIATTRGSRSAKIKRSGAANFVSALSGISHDSSWLELQPGSNAYRVWSDTGGAPYSLSWLIRHGGL